MLVECIRRDRAVVIDEDGTRTEPCYAIGDQEWNLPRRYSYPEFMTIMGDAEYREAYGVTDPSKTRALPTLGHREPVGIRHERLHDQAARSPFLPALW